MPAAVKFFMTHATIGMLIGVIATTGLYIADIGGIGSMLEKSPDRNVLLFLLVFFLGSTLAAAQVAIALLLTEPEEDYQDQDL